MVREALSAKVEALAEHLRKREDDKIGLPDLAAASDVLVKTMEAFFGSIDTTIYNEFQALSKYILVARKEIAELRPEGIKNARIPRAGQELDAIVQSTEQATNTIMEAAEEMMSSDAADLDSYKAVVDAACMQIFEACSFQDITGQRISKVVETLIFIENHIGVMTDVLGVTAEDVSAEEEAEGDKALLNGPALEGEGIDQDEVDALIEKEAAASGAMPAKVAATAKKVVSEEAAQDAPASPPEEVAPAEEASQDAAASAADEEVSEEASQDDIDALFS